VNQQVKTPVEPKNVQLFVVFVLVGLPSGNLDDGIDFIGRGSTYGQRKIFVMASVGAIFTETS